MATYTFDIRLDKIVPHKARITVEADNIADAIQQVRSDNGDGAVWEPEGNGYWGDDLVVDGIERSTDNKPMAFDVSGEPIDQSGLAWFKRDEARRLSK